MANSLVTAPRRKKSRSVRGGMLAPLVRRIARRRIIRFLSCSNSCRRFRYVRTARGLWPRKDTSRAHRELKDRVRDEDECGTEPVEEGSRSVGAQDVENGLDDTAALLDDLLRRAGGGIRRDGRADRLPGLRWGRNAGQAIAA